MAESLILALCDVCEHTLRDHESDGVSGSVAFLDARCLLTPEDVYARFVERYGSFPYREVVEYV